MRIFSSVAILALIGSAAAQACGSYHDCPEGWICCAQPGDLGMCTAYGCGGVLPPAARPSTNETYDESTFTMVEPIFEQFEYDASYTPSTNETYDESTVSMVEPIFDQFEYDANYTTNFTHGVEEQAKRFVHTNGLKIAGIAAVAYILYKTFFKSSATSVLPTTNACTYNYGQKGVQQVQYAVWVPPTVIQQQPLVQKEASQMN